MFSSLTILISLVAGSMFAMWLGQLITEQGIGNGISLIIFGGIVSQLPANMGQLVQTQQYVLLMMFILVTVVTMAVIVVVLEGQRRILVQYGKRVRVMRGNRLMVAGGQSTYIPLRVNTAGMIPIIFAQSLLLFPGTIASYFQNAPGIVGSIATVLYQHLQPSSAVYWILYFLLVIAFTYFYTDVIFREQNLAESLQKQGGFVPGIRPGKRTEDYLNAVMSRITFVGALFLGGIAILPWLVSLVTRQDMTSNTTVAGLQLWPADRGGRGVGHDEAIGGAALDAPLRGLHPLSCPKRSDKLRSASRRADKPSGGYDNDVNLSCLSDLHRAAWRRQRHSGRHVGERTWTETGLLR